ncbi:MAG: hypothetical protein KGL69_04245 [Alphaproteobacteria bacterium]|nr:hypothetical protein [Alphaproteobacteria bacterium]
MKHAGPAALVRLQDLLAVLRARGDLKEVRPGVFYRRGRACLHFHEDPSGLYADVRAPHDADFTRIKLGGPADAAALIAQLDKAP